MNKHKGAFTLIEMLIAMAILSFISVGVYQLTASTFEMRESWRTKRTSTIPCALP